MSPLTVADLSLPVLCALVRQPPSSLHLDTDSRAYANRSLTRPSASANLTLFQFMLLSSCSRPPSSLPSLLRLLQHGLTLTTLGSSSRLTLPPSRRRFFCTASRHSTHLLVTPVRLCASSQSFGLARFPLAAALMCTSNVSTRSTATSSESVSVLRLFHVIINLTHRGRSERALHSRPLYDTTAPWGVWPPQRLV